MLENLLQSSKRESNLVHFPKCQIILSKSAEKKEHMQIQKQEG